MKPISELRKQIISQRGYRKSYNVEHGLSLLNFDEFKDKKIMEVACGKGLLSLLIANYCKEVVGVDILEEEVQAARLNQQKYKIENCTFVTSDIGLTDFEIESFDVIVAEAALHHIIYDYRIGTKLCEYLKPGGRLIFIAEPLGYNWLSEFVRFIRHHRTHAVGEFSLWFDNVGQFASSFSEVKYHYFDIFSHPFKVLELILPHSIFMIVMKRMWQIDELIYKYLPILRKYSPNVNIEMIKGD